MRRGFRGGLVALATLGLLLTIAVAVCSAQTLEDCIQATCKVRADDGSTGTGTLYAYGEHRRKRVGLVVTCAHVTTTQYATCWFGRAKVKTRGVVIWKRRDIDSAVIAVDVRWFTRRLIPVPLFRPRVRLRVGQAIFSIGHPAGGPALLWRGVLRGYNSVGSLVFWPGPELGRSGSAVCVFDNQDRAAIVGIISTRDGEYLTPRTMGQAVSIDHLKSRRTQTSLDLFPVAVTVPGACGPYGCPPADSAAGRRYKSPYRYKMDERVQGLEKSQGTLPLPPPPQQLPPQLPPQQQCPPPVDLLPLLTRLNAMSAELAAVKGELVTVKGEVVVLTERADNVKATAESLAKRYEDELPGIVENLEKTVEAPLKQVKDVADAAAEDAAAAGEEAAAATKEAKGLRARIEEAKAAGAEGIKEVAKAVVWGIISDYGVWSLGVIGLGVFLVYRRIKTGESVLRRGVRRLRKRVAALREKAGEVVDPEEDDDDEDATA